MVRFMMVMVPELSKLTLHPAGRPSKETRRPARPSPG
jgi:hypothetical protein